MYIFKPCLLLTIIKPNSFRCNHNAAISWKMIFFKVIIPSKSYTAHLTGTFAAGLLGCGMWWNLQRLGFLHTETIRLHQIDIWGFCRQGKKKKSKMCCVFFVGVLLLCGGSDWSVKIKIAGNCQSNKSVWMLGCRFFPHRMLLCKKMSSAALFTCD